MIRPIYPQTFRQLRITATARGVVDLYLAFLT